jgi:integrase
MTDLHLSSSLQPSYSPIATPTRRRRGPSLSRRSGQRGCIVQHCKTWDAKKPCYGKFWIDTANGRRRQSIALGICPTRSIARQRLGEHIERSGLNSKQSFISNTAPGTTFRAQAERWIEHLPTRRRRPVKPSTVFGWRHALDKWLLPHLGDLLLSEVANSTLRELVSKMAEAGLSPKTIVNHAQVVKMVVASAVNVNGDELYPRKWNHEFIQLPIVDKARQNRPTVTTAELEAILSGVKRKYAVLFALMAGTGLRAGEALALKASDLSSDCRLLHVQRSVWRCKEQTPKTTNAIRLVDIAEPLAKILRDYEAGKGYLFATVDGGPLEQRNVLHVLHSVRKCGFHVFRRYRTAVLRKARVPEDLIKLWLGHSQNLTDRYASQLREDVEFRTEWCERTGLGFSAGTLGTQKAAAIATASVVYPLRWQEDGNGCGGQI